MKSTRIRLNPLLGGVGVSFHREGSEAWSAKYNPGYGSACIGCRGHGVSRSSVKCDYRFELLIDAITARVVN